MVKVMKTSRMTRGAERTRGQGENCRLAGFATVAQFAVDLLLSVSVVWLHNEYRYWLQVQEGSRCSRLHGALALDGTGVQLGP